MLWGHTLEDTILLRSFNCRKTDSDRTSSLKERNVLCSYIFISANVFLCLLNEPEALWRIAVVCKQDVFVRWQTFIINLVTFLRSFVLSHAFRACTNIGIKFILPFHLSRFFLTWSVSLLRQIKPAFLLNISSIQFCLNEQHATSPALLFLVSFLFTSGNVARTVQDYTVFFNAPSAQSLASIISSRIDKSFATLAFTLANSFMLVENRSPGGLNLKWSFSGGGWESFLSGAGVTLLTRSTQSWKPRLETIEQSFRSLKRNQWETNRCIYG